MGKEKRYRESQRDSAHRIVMKDLCEFSKAYVVPLADFHLGCGCVAQDVIEGYLKWIKSRDNAFTILNGDLMNCAGKDTSPELWEDLITPDDAYAELRAMLEPIKDKILMITRGGHEEAIFHKVGADYMARLAYDLGDIPYKPNGGMVGLRLSRNNHRVVFWGYATHGWGGARTIGAKIKKSEDLAMVADVDFYVLSHDHTQAIHRLNVLTPPRSHISVKNPIYMRPTRKLLINTGGFIDYSGYIQRKGYAPQDLGTPRIRLEIKEASKGGLGYYKDLHSSM